MNNIVKKYILKQDKHNKNMFLGRYRPPEKKYPAVAVSPVTCTPIWPRYTSAPAEWKGATGPSLRSPS